MKNLLKYIVGLLLFTGASAQAESEMVALPPSFCVQNFNAYGPIYALNLKARTEILSRELLTRDSCDVIHLQEVWNESHIDQLEDLLKRRYLMSMPNRESRIGLMSLFQFELGEQETHNFVVNDEGGFLDTIRSVFKVKKAFHVVKADPRLLDEQMYFVNTHLHPTSQAIRVTQLVDILEWRLQHQDLKMILSGDLNANPQDLERGLALVLLGTRDGLYESVGDYPKGLCTYCVVNPTGWKMSDQVFDYILYSNIGEAQSSLFVQSAAINLKGTPRKPLSDHYGVKIEFGYKKNLIPQTRDSQNMRRETAVLYISQALRVLEKEKKAEFKPYQEKLTQYRDQLFSGEGTFSNYFEKFR